MKVGIDLTSLLYHRGVSRYTGDLFRALCDFPTLRLYGYASVSRRAQKKLIGELEAVRASLDESSQENFWAQIKLQKNSPTLNHLYWHYLGLNPVKKVLPEIEVFHSWDFLQPPDKDLALVSTIHDLAMLKYPRIAVGKVWRYHHESWRILRQRRAHLIAVSESTRQDVITYLDWPAERVHLVYEALPSASMIPPEHLTEQGWQMVASAYRLSRPYILFVGTREPRKNLPHLLQAWEALAGEVDLVMVGAAGNEKLETSASAHLHLLEHVTDEELAYLYSHAVALAYPSLDEGFGLPILEGFYYGTPVVTSNCGAMAEVGGKAAILVEPLETGSIREGLERVLAQSKQEAKKRRDLARVQLGQFSWERTARETLAVYQKAIEDFYDR